MIWKVGVHGRIILFWKFSFNFLRPEKISRRKLLESGGLIKDTFCRIQWKASAKRVASADRFLSSFRATNRQWPPLCRSLKTRRVLRRRVENGPSFTNCHLPTECVHSLIGCCLPVQSDWQTATFHFWPSTAFFTTRFSQVGKTLKMAPAQEMISDFRPYYSEQLRTNRTLWPFPLGFSPVHLREGRSLVSVDRGLSRQRQSASSVHFDGGKRRKRLGLACSMTINSCQSDSVRVGASPPKNANVAALSHWAKGAKCSFTIVTLHLQHLALFFNCLV